MNFLNFEHQGSSPSGKTQMWHVTNKSGIFLGIIRWHAAWRKYVFETAVVGPFIFDHQCLTELAEFCKSQTDAHRAKPVTKDFDPDTPASEARRYDWQ